MFPLSVSKQTPPGQARLQRIEPGLGQYQIIFY